MQPLDVFVAAAQAANPDNREARATVDERVAEARESAGKFLPSFNATGTYTRNQYQVALSVPSGGGLESLNVLPSNEGDASFKLTVPIVDVGAWERTSSSRASADAARANRDATQLDIERDVARDYYQLTGAEALLASARETLDVAQRNVTLVRDQSKSGVASDLDVERALADVASAEQDVASAGLQVVTGRRALATLSGLEPDGPSNVPPDDLHEEPPLVSFTGTSVVGLPSVKAASTAFRAADADLRAAHAAWLPTLSAAAEERLTNATALSGGHGEYYLFTATASWHFDFATAPTEQARSAALDVARVREDRARRDAEDTIFNAWHQVHVDIEKARSARAQVVQTKLAVELARVRYASGVATELELLQAARDAFRADASRIQADADIAYAREALRISVNRPKGSKEKP
jgi:outer membrane protein TolC